MLGAGQCEAAAHRFKLLRMMSISRTENTPRGDLGLNEK